MKQNIPSPVRRVALLLPALGLMLASSAALAKEEADPERQRNTEELVLDQGGRAGIIEEFNFGPTGMDVTLQREDRRDEGGTRLLSGRVIELKGRTLYVERGGVVVPLDVSALRIHKQPQEGQEIIASYRVNRTDNVALTLAGEVQPPLASE
jgi:hypothetical protein